MAAKKLITIGEIETSIEQFDGGMVNDKRTLAANTGRVISNFDILTNPKKMTPYRSSESGDSAPTTSQKQNFCIAFDGSNYNLYSLGVKSGANTAEVLKKSLTTGGTNDLGDNGWAAPTANQSGTGATNFNLFVYYKKVGLIFGAQGGGNLWTFSPSGSAWNDTAHALAYTKMAQGLVHSKDDILYIPYSDNSSPAIPKIAVNNNGTWTDSGLSLPVDYVITSICEYGNYLAIGCAPVSGIGSSRVYLWDRDTGLSSVSESIDWGTGSLKILESVDGVLIGISQRGGASSTSGLGEPATFGFGDKVIVRYLNGDRAEKLFEIQGGTNSTIIPVYKQKVDNRLFFQMLINFNNSVRDGVFSIGRASPSFPFTLIHERTSNNNTALTTSDTVTGFMVLEDFIFQSYKSAGSFALTKTDDTLLYNHNSVFESKRYNAGDSSLKKDLKGITIKHEYLPSGASVTVNYRTDQNTAWTALFTSNATNAISASAVFQGGGFPTDYKEIEFQILSTGGAEITGLSWKEEITGKREYE